jgi:hypothetical protein
MPQRSIDSVEALYRKLERTFHRREAYGDQQVDWVFDVSMTAWHLVDWTARARGVPVRTTQDAFKTRCPELAVCEQLCNGAKHYVLDNPKLQPFNVATDVRATNDLIGISRMNAVAGDTNVEIRLTAAVSVVDKDGNVWEALGLFLAVLRFWERELGLPLEAG